MELKDFVKMSIVEIIQGVSEAMDEVKGHSSAVVNPAPSHSYFANPQNISFDVAVTVQDESSLSGKAGGGIAILKASVNGENITSNTAATRISFHVPVSLPSSPKKQYENKSLNARVTGF